jgi:hypothetical protein
MGNVYRYTVLHSAAAACLGVPEEGELLFFFPTAFLALLLVLDPALLLPPTLTTAMAMLAGEHRRDAPAPTWPCRLHRC